MHKLTAIIVDDEADGRSTLSSYLEQYCPEATVVAEADSVHEAALAIRTFNPDLVFLDINMPYENGFSLFEKIPQPDFHTVFVTAYDAYALQAIKQHALDYILKPINIDELITAVQQAMSWSEKTASGSDRRDGQEADISQLLLSMQRQSKGIEKIALPVLDGFIYVESADIIRCEAEGSYTHFYFANRPRLLVCRMLGYYEELLQSQGFIRVHHHHLINIAHVQQYHKGRGGVITMSDKSDVGVSQRRKDDFLKIMEYNRRD